LNTDIYIGLEINTIIPSKPVISIMWCSDNINNSLCQPHTVGLHHICQTDHTSTVSHN